MAILLETLLPSIPAAKLAVHCHDTYGQALANILVALQHGIAVIDASVSGLGGCPYAPGASGNVASEDVVDLFERQGIATGVDLDALVDATQWVEREVLQRPLPGRVYRAVSGQRERA